MRKIKLRCTRYKGKRRIFLEFVYNQEMINLVRQLPDARWSQEKKSWHIRDEPGIMKKIEEKFQGKAELDTSDIRKNYKNERLVSHVQSHNQEVVNAVKSFKMHLLQQRYSTNTINTYTEGLGLFLSWIAKPIDEITNEDLLIL